MEFVRDRRSQEEIVPVDDLPLPPRRWGADGAGGWEKRGAGRVVFLDGKWRLRWLIDSYFDGDLFTSPLGEFDSAEQAMNAADTDAENIWPVEYGEWWPEPPWE